LLMQIRIANRQDEKKIIAFVEEIFGEQGGTIELS